MIRLANFVFERVKINASCPAIPIITFISGKELATICLNFANEPVAEARVGIHKSSALMVPYFRSGKNCTGIG